MAKRKCPYCSQWIEKDEEYTYHKAYPKRFIHKKCEDKVEQEYLHKQKEEKELASLITTIAKIHNISKQMLPKLAYVALQNLREGRAPFESMKLGRTAKKGFEFSVIEQCYKENDDRIRDILYRKSFDDTLSEFKYILTVIINKLPKTKIRMEKEQINNLRIKDDLEKLNNGENFVVEYNDIMERHKKSNKKTIDISKYLEDNDTEEALF